MVRLRHVLGGLSTVFRVVTGWAVDVGDMSIKTLKYHCTSDIMEAGGEASGAMTVGTVLDCGSRILCLCRRAVAKIGRSLSRQAEGVAISRETVGAGRGCVICRWPLVLLGGL